PSREYTVSTIGEIEAEFTRVCGSEGASWPRDTLVRRVYDQVHCRLADSGRGDWSNRRHALESLRRASDLIAAEPVRYGGFGSRGTMPDGRTILGDADGIELVAPDGAVVTEDPTGIVVTAPALALAQEGRWLVWSSTAELPGSGMARLYVNARPEV